MNMTQSIGVSYRLTLHKLHQRSSPTACVTRWWVGPDNTTLPEPASSQTNCRKTRRLPPPWSRCPSEGRVHAVLGNLYANRNDSWKKTPL